MNECKTVNDNQNSPQQSYYIVVSKPYYKKLELAFRQDIFNMI